MTGRPRRGPVAAKGSWHHRARRRLQPRSGPVGCVDALEPRDRLSNAPTWMVGLASSLGPPVTILVAVAFLGERLKAIQWLGLVGVAIGMIAIGLP